jgi:cytochrome c oxidase subunit 3
MSQATADSHASAHHEHDPYVAHHFESAEQQMSSIKLGMWVFLATEILMFGGLFCGYAVWRHNVPESFEYGHRLLATNLGAINTVILICSSFTMAWGVRAAQLGQKTLLIVLLALTLLGGFGFMGIKYVEYSSKFAHGTGPGMFFDADQIRHHFGEHGPGHTPAAGAETEAGDAHAHAGGEAAKPGPISPARMTYAEPRPPGGSDLQAPAGPPVGLSPKFIGPEPDDGTPAGHAKEPLTPEQVLASANFVNIYFLMTGLHGVHVLIGLALISWLLVKAIRGAFGPKRFAPVDVVGLYWHLVDLIWIFLFPLLYLIH